MGSVLGGGGGGGSGGDEANTTEKALPSPAQIAATREAFNTASGIAGAAKNLPYFSQIASSPGYRQALQQTANTWNGWMGTPDMDLSQGTAPVTQGPFGSVIDAGGIMNQQMAGMSPEVQKILAQWTGPGAIRQGDAYSPAVYDPYVQQKPLLHQGTAAQGGVGTIGAGGIPAAALPATPGTGTPGTGTPGTGTPGTGTPGGGLTGSNGKGGTFRPPGGGGTMTIGGRTYHKNAQGKWVLAAGRRYGGGQGGMGPDPRLGTGFGGTSGGWAHGNLGGLGGLFGGNNPTGSGGDFNHGMY